MKSRFFLLAGLTAILVISTGYRVRAATVVAASCSSADVATAVAASSDGDTVEIPAGNCTWTSSVAFTKGITLKGQTNCSTSTWHPPSDDTGHTYDKTDIPWQEGDCATIITDGIVGTTPVLDVTIPAGSTKFFRLAHLQFEAGGSRTSERAIRINGQTGGSALDGRQCQIDHTRMIDLDTSPFIDPTTCEGLIDHNYFERSTLDYFIKSAFPGTDFLTTNARWAEAPPFGASNVLVIESNVFAYSGVGTDGATVIDGWAGWRVVFRFNYAQNGSVTVHGTESGGPQRGARSWEIYGNRFTVANGAQMRAGSGFFWGNTWKSFDGATPQVASMVTNRYQTNLASHLCAADGTCVYDVNDAGNPQEGPLTAASVGGSSPNWTVTVAGTPWVVDEWIGYNAKKDGCVTTAVDQCHGQITANTNNTLTINTNSGLTTRPIESGESFTINKVTHMFDNSCRGQGTKLVYATWDITSTGTAATATKTAHGLSGGQYFTVASAAQSLHEGTFLITSVTANTIDYTLHGSLTNSSNNATAGPAPASNDQVTEGCYQWSNILDASTVLAFGPDHLQSRPVRSGTHKFDWDGILQDAGSPGFDGSLSAAQTGKGVGVGPIASRPATCSTGVGYWATNEGEWDSTNGATADGRFYKCTATNTWTLTYTPYTYPHPLVISDVVTPTGRRAHLPRRVR